MKKLWVVLLAMVMAFALAACGGGDDASDGEEAAGGGDAYETQTFNLNNWEITITNDEVIYDEDNECDNLIISLTAVNNKEEAAALENTANINADQGEEDLDVEAIRDEDGNAVYYDYEDWGSEVAAGESIDLQIGWQLISDEVVRVNFGGYSVAVESTEITFEVADRLTQ